MVSIRLYTDELRCSLLNLSDFKAYSQNFSASVLNSGECKTICFILSQRIQPSLKYFFEDPVL